MVGVDVEVDVEVDVDVDVDVDGKVAVAVAVDVDVAVDGDVDFVEDEGAAVAVGRTSKWTSISSSSLKSYQNFELSILQSFEIYWGRWWQFCQNSFWLIM